MAKVNVILLSGGSGTRLWPLSNGVRSKQFLKLLKAPDGNLESMFQRVMRQMKESKLDARVVVATSESQRDSILSQGGDCAEIVLEPEMRDTFPAIALSASYLLKEKGCSSDDVVVVMPIDPYTEISYFDTIAKMAEVAQNNAASIVLMGIVPTEPSSKYGYIIPESKPEFDIPTPVASFTEKPTRDAATEMIARGALWNGGVFAFKLGYINDIIKKYVDAPTFEETRAKYSSFPKISVDYEVVEKESSIAVIPFKGEWRDLGTWNMLTQNLASTTMGNSVLYASENSNIINELDIPIAGLGLKNIVIAASADGVLVSEKEASEGIKNYLTNKSRPMCEERRWGDYKVLNGNILSDGAKTLTKLLSFKDGAALSYQRHNFRKEIWTVIDGEGLLYIEGAYRKVKRGDVIDIEAGQLHAVKAISNLRIIEIQIGSNLLESDIERISFDWDSQYK